MSMRFARRSRTSLGIASALLLLAPGCRAPRPSEPGPGLASPSSAPAWLHQAESWDKLDAIEAWLGGPGPADHPEMVPEAELELAEGRLHFAQDDRGNVAESSLAVRLAAAENGFHRVLASPEASSMQRSRATNGLGLARELRTGASSGSSLGLTILPRSAWHASPPIPSRLTPATPYDRITVHHSTTPRSELSQTSRNVSSSRRRSSRFHG